MPNKRLKKNWEHPLYKYGYIKNRDGYCQSVINYKGRQYRKSLMLAFSINNKKLALELLEEEIMKIIYNRPNYILRITDLINKFLSIKESILNKKTLERYKSIFKYYNFENLTTADNLKEHIISININSELSNNTKNLSLTTLKAFFNFCVENQYIEDNPIQKILVPKMQPKEIKLYNDSDIKTLIDYFDKKNKQMKQLIQLINSAGFRLSEALSFNPGMVKNGVITITGKGGYVRHIPLSISKSFPEIIANFIPFTYNNLASYTFQFKSACDKLKLDYLGFHAIRKTFENRLIQMEIPSDLVAEILGHTPEIQRKHYKKLSNAEQIKTRIEKFNV